jgi:clan AA aspartic protease (TIGR02281 family)
VRITLLVLLALALAAPAAAEIYRWTDAAGRVHFTQDLRSVPRERRAEALAAASRDALAERLQVFPSQGDPARDDPVAPPPPPRRGGVLRIPFQKHGTLMMVEARLNDGPLAPFLVDTGASHISIPSALVDRLGLRIGSDTPRVSVQTANGLIAVPVVTLEAVQAGDARVEHIEAYVNPAMEFGLLGGSFFNNFVYQVDAASNVITLVANERVRGGLTELQWRDRFRELRALLAELDQHLANPPARDGRVRELSKKRSELELVLRDLEREANSARVPQAWRR